MPPKFSQYQKCEWVTLQRALHHFGTYSGRTQSQQHIKPLHWYVACRLVLEGGFLPEEITPRPPFRVDVRGGRHYLTFDPSKAGGGERTLLGGLKTKDVDIVVTKEGIGPVIAISCKGMTGAFRNLTNRMEETIGECTNLHITYPAMVFGYMFVIRANRRVVRATETVGLTESSSEDSDERLKANDIAMQIGGEPVESIFRFHTALKELTGRHGIRSDVSRYESVALALVETNGDSSGNVLEHFPPSDSPIRMEDFFSTLFLRYEERFLLSAPDLSVVTRRRQWTIDPVGFDPSDDARSQQHLAYLIRTAPAKEKKSKVVAKKTSRVKASP